MQRMVENPDAMRSVMQMASMMGAAAGQGGSGLANAAGNPDPNNPTVNAFGNPFNLNLFGPGGGLAASPPPPVDNRPPEERYAEQLRQLNEMGFYEFDRNVTALRRSGGSVQGAVEYLLSG
jgi:ubiquilin